MPTVTVDGEKSFEAEAGKKLVLAIEDAGIDILHRCGGNCKCTTCRVQVVSGHAMPMGEPEEQTRLAREGSLGPDIRLSCQMRVEGDIDVKVLGRAAAAGHDARHQPAGLTRTSPSAGQGSAAQPCSSLHFLQRAMSRRTRPPQRLQRVNFAWRVDFLRGR